MELIKLGATDSTNAHLKKLSLEKDLADGTILWADFQRRGRGQQDRSWQSEANKNLCISRLQKFDSFPVKNQFTINSAVSLACFHTICDLGVPNLSIKWPNDIMAGSKKLGGILIENIVNGKTISKSIIGIGLNINQDSFPGLPLATSLKIILGKEIKRKRVLEILAEALDFQFENMTENSDELRQKYEEKLFMLNREATFEENHHLIRGIIRGVDKQGKLLVETEGQLREFGRHEISMKLS